MKKSTFLAIIGVILAFFIVSTIGQKVRIYEKKVMFEKPEDAINSFMDYINTYEMVKDDNGYYKVQSKEFMESISKRYRLYIDSESLYPFIFIEIPVLYNYEIEEVDFNSMPIFKENYEDSLKNLENYPIDNNPKVYKISGESIYNIYIDKATVNKDGTINNNFTQEAVPTTVYLVLVNEGEGYVVDYYTVVQ